MHDQKRKSKFAAEGVALVVFVLLILFYTWPAARSLGKVVIGSNFAFGHLWNWDLLIGGILEEGRLITHTNMINYPDGGSLAVIGWSYILLLLVLRFFGMGLLLATNLIVFFHLLLACYFAYRLALKLTNNWPASVVAGIAYGLCPYALSLLWNAQYPKLSHGFLPLLLLLLLEVVRLNRWWPLLVTGAVLALLTATSPYNGIFAALLALMAGGYFLLRSTRAKQPVVLLRLLLTAAVAVLMILPYLGYISMTDQSDSLTRPARHLNLNGTGSEEVEPTFYYARPEGCFLPGKIQRSGFVDVYHIYYIGLILLFLAVLGLAIGLKKDPDREAGYSPWFFLLILLVFGVISVGYFAYWGKYIHDPSTIRIGLPLYWLYSLFPQVAVFGVPYRAMIGVMLALTMLAAMGMNSLTGRLNAAKRVAVCFGIGVAMVAETVFLSPLPLPIASREIGVPGAYQDLAEMADGEAVLDVPNEAVRADPMLNKLLMYFQLVHGHPLPIPEEIRPKSNTLFGRFNNLLADLLADGRIEPADEPQKCMLLPFKYMVFHKGIIWLPPSDWERCLEYLSKHFDLLSVDEEAKVWLFRVRDCAGPSPGKPLFCHDPRIVSNRN